MKIILLLSILLSFNLAYSLDESVSFSEIKTILLEGKKCDLRPEEDFWKVGTVRTEVHTKFWKKETYPLTFSKFGCGLGVNGSIVISPGRTESSLEFYETAIDFVAQGFSPIYVVDHVSQGFSKRLLEDRHKGHIFRFSDYVDAFDDAVQHFERDLEVTEGRLNKEKSPLFYLSNSMGGAVGIGYFQKLGENNPFKAAAMLSAMIRINYLGFPDGNPELPNGVTHPTPVQTKLFSEAGVILQARYFCKTLGCDAYATKGARETVEEFGSAYVEGRRNFITAFSLAPEQVMTHSKNRYDLKTFMWESDQMKAVYDQMGLIVPQLAAPTYQWAKQAAKFNSNMRRDESIENMNTMPLMVITGEKDVRSYTPYQDGSTDLFEHVNFCKSVSRVKGEGVCKFLQIDKGFHELHKESDEFRNPSLKAALDHFSESNQ